MNYLLMQGPKQNETCKYLYPSKIIKESFREASQREQGKTEKEFKYRLYEKKKMVQMLTGVQKRPQRLSSGCLTVSQINRQEELNHAGVQPLPEPPHREREDVSVALSDRGGNE